MSCNHDDAVTDGRHRNQVKTIGCLCGQVMRRQNVPIAGKMKERKKNRQTDKE